MRKILGILVLLVAAGSVMAQVNGAKAGDASSEDAKAQALKIYKAMQRHDWKEIFQLSAFSPVLTKSLGSDANAGAKAIGNAVGSDPDGKKVFDAVTKSMSDVAVGEPIIMGDKANVPTTSTAKLDGKDVKFRGLARLIKSGGVWKWDLTSSDDIETATAEALTELLGSME